MTLKTTGILIAAVVILFSATLIGVAIFLYFTNPEVLNKPRKNNVKFTTCDVVNITLAQRYKIQAWIPANARNSGRGRNNTSLVLNERRNR